MALDAATQGPAAPLPAGKVARRRLSAVI